MRLVVLVAAGVLLLDQATKAWAVSALTGQPPRDLIGSFLLLDLISNPGAAFSLGTGSTVVLTAVGVVVLLVVVRYVSRLGNAAWAWVFGLLAGGALGNLVDRLIREPGPGRGHVVDFLDYNGWFIGNVADIAIVVAAGLVVLLSLRGVAVDGSAAGDGAGGAVPGDRGGAPTDAR